MQGNRQPVRLTGILPTRGRQKWALEALQGFFAQRWDGPKHLVIIDDFDEPSFPDGLPDCSATYCWLNDRLTIGAKRNLAVSVAEDGYIIHIDSDDWSDPTRAETQRKLMEESGRAVTGFHTLLFFDETTRKVYRLNGPAQKCAFGSTLMYRRDWWNAHPFNDKVELGEDNRFVAVARDSGQLATMQAERLMVARIHPGNSGTKVPQLWEPMTLADLPQSFPV
jgi:hypothetical protein